MPTGYTAAIAQGITFEQFAINCSGVLGAWYEPAAAPYPEEIKPSDQHRIALQDIQAQQTVLLGLTDAEMEDGTTLANKTTAERHQGYHDEADTLRAQYEAMLAQVQAWTPPPNEHGLKAFMVAQITMSIESDCGHTKTPAPLSVSEWYSHELRNAARDIKYHTEAHAAELERTKHRNAWIKALHESLKPAA